VTARAYLERHSLAAALDDLVLPALARSREDLGSGVLEPEDEESIRQACRRIAHELAGAGPPPETAATVSTAAEAAEASSESERADAPAVHVVGCPTRTLTDEAALELLALLLRGPGYRVAIVSSGLLVSETLAVVGRARPAAVCVGAVGRGGLAQARYLLKRLAAGDYDLAVVVGLFGFRRRGRLAGDRLLSAGAAHVGETLAETAAHCIQLVQHAIARDGLAADDAARRARSSLLADGAPAGRARD
jgi:hypothetical protein